MAHGMTDLEAGGRGMGCRLAFRTARRIAVPGLIAGTIMMAGTGLSAAAARPPVTVIPTDVMPGGTLRVSGPSCVIASGGVGVGGVIVALNAPKQATRASSLTNGPWKTVITVPADEPPGRYQITAFCTFANVGGGKRSFRYRPVTVNVGPPPGARATSVTPPACGTPS